VDYTYLHCLHTLLATTYRRIHCKKANVKSVLVSRCRRLELMGMGNPDS
jgi:hypothetical protein